MASSVTFGDQVEELSRALKRVAGGRGELYALVPRLARALVRSDGATLVLRDGDRCHYVAEDAISPLWAGERYPMTSCISGWVMLHHEPAVIENIYADQRIPHEAYRPTFVTSLAMVPIRTEDPVGAIGAYWAERHRPSDKEITMIRALADATSGALTNAG